MPTVMSIINSKIRAKMSRIVPVKRMIMMYGSTINRCSWSSPPCFVVATISSEVAISAFQLAPSPSRRMFVQEMIPMKPIMDLLDTGRSLPGNTCAKDEPVRESHSFLLFSGDPGLTRFQHNYPKEKLHTKREEAHWWPIIA